MGLKQCGNNIVVKSSVGYAVDRHLQNNNGKNTGTKINSRTVGAASCGLAMQEAVRAADISSRFANGLENLNTARGGQKGLFGFVGEEMQAADASINGKMTYVINNNGAADLVYVGKNGHKYYQQVKLGYEKNFGQKINFAEYKGQTIVVDKGNPSFAKIKAEGAKHGVKVIEGNITKSEAQELARYMQQETAITGAKKAVIVPKVAAAHKAGLSTAKAGALYGAGFSMGSNLVDVACGDKEIGEAAKDTAVSYAAGYALGAAGSAVASTSAGAAMISGVSAAGTAVTSTTVGAALASGATAAGATVAGAGAAATGAVVGSVAAAGSAIGSAAVAATAGTAIGGAVAGGVAATAAAGAAVGAAAVAAAPVVAVGTVVGLGYSLVRKLFD